MNTKEWQAIEEAGKIFQLGERATLGEIKRAYHRLSKQYHPDCNGGSGAEAECNEQMHRLSAAYERLMRYCSEYRFPLTRAKADPADVHDPEQWWMERFGEDRLWGRKR
ncbi:MAG: molecular chaperone DnaJ [Desulfobulbus propionicus]|nr:MAG: molecular chaperone DnaJ [Desulfobulbus propionicus]